MENGVPRNPERLARGGEVKAVGNMNCRRLCGPGCRPALASARGGRGSRTHSRLRAPPAGRRGRGAHASPPRDQAAPRGQVTCSPRPHKGSSLNLPASAPAALPTLPGPLGQLRGAAESARGRPGSQGEGEPTQVLPTPQPPVHLSVCPGWPLGGCDHPCPTAPGSACLLQGSQPHPGVQPPLAGPPAHALAAPPAHLPPKPAANL